MKLFRRFILNIMKQHLDQALNGPQSQLKALEERVTEVESEWSLVGDELDRTFKKVHSELGHINRAKRGKKPEGMDLSEEQATATAPALRAPFGGVGLMPHRNLLNKLGGE